MGIEVAAVLVVAVIMGAGIASLLIVSLRLGRAAHRIESGMKVLSLLEHLPELQKKVGLLEAFVKKNSKDIAELHRVKEHRVVERNFDEETKT